MSKPVVYLAGPISGLSYTEAQAWKHPFYSMLDDVVTFRDPMRGKEILASMAVIQKSYEQLGPLFTAQGIGSRDMGDVRSADAVLAYVYPGIPVSAGMLIEIGWATAWNKPVVVFAPNPEEKILNHAFFKGLQGIYVAHTHQNAAALLIYILGV